MGQGLAGIGISHEKMAFKGVWPFGVSKYEGKFAMVPKFSSVLILHGKKKWNCSIIPHGSDRNVYSVSRYSYCDPFYVGLISRAPRLNEHL